MFQNIYRFLYLLYFILILCDCKIKKPKFLSGLEGDDNFDWDSKKVQLFGTGEFSNVDKVRFCFVGSILDNIWASQTITA